MFLQWKGPGSVDGKFCEHSYFVQMPGGAQKLVHASKLQPYQKRVMTVGVIFDEDMAFGEVEYVPRSVSSRATVSDLPKDMTAHLKVEEGDLICKEFAEHRSLFDDKPGVARIVEHRIVIEEGFTPKSGYPYRIPASLKGEVGKQVDKLLEMSLIFLCKSPHAHPVVCVPKKDGSLRMCVDFR
ncbi:hypothetical protein V5799_028056 [Amblyomma americanum]|uniref:Uncharacterized protein n=1 Tax=Amblyomma americanum TaxID=6943 RepID=A0AAQ4DDY7_AMBAM